MLQLSLARIVTRQGKKCFHIGAAFAKLHYVVRMPLLLYGNLFFPVLYISLKAELQCTAAFHDFVDSRFGLFVAAFFACAWGHTFLSSRSSRLRIHRR